MVRATPPHHSRFHKYPERVVANDNHAASFGSETFRGATIASEGSAAFCTAPDGGDSEQHSGAIRNVVAAVTIGAEDWRVAFDLLST